MQRRRRRMTMFELVGFDGDDTLWRSQDFFDEAQAAFEAILAPYLDLADARLASLDDASAELAAARRASGRVQALRAALGTGLQLGSLVALLAVGSLGSDVAIAATVVTVVATATAVATTAAAFDPAEAAHGRRAMAPPSIVVAMLPLGVVVDRLRGLVGPGQLGRVALSARLAEMADWQMPAVCVMPGDDRAASAGEHAPQLIDVEMLVVVAVRNLADGRGEGALAAAQNMLQANPDITGIFGFGDDAALAAAVAVKAAGLQDQVKVIGFDGMEEARKAVDSDPVMVGVIQQFPAEMGKTAVDTAVKVIAGEDVPAEQPIVPGVYLKK